MAEKPAPPCLARSGVAGALGRLFWGTTIVILDLNVGRFDLIHDTLGYLLIALGIARLRRVDVSERYDLKMTLALAASVIAAPMALFEPVHDGTLRGLAVVHGVFTIFGAAALLLFISAMREASSASGFRRVEASWRFTFLLLAPLAVLSASMGLVEALRPAPRIELQGTGLLPLIVAGAAWAFGAAVHFLVSLHRTRRELDRWAAAARREDRLRSGAPSADRTA